MPELRVTAMAGGFRTPCIESFFESFRSDAESQFSPPLLTQELCAFGLGYSEQCVSMLCDIATIACTIGTTGSVP